MYMHAWMFFFSPYSRSISSWPCLCCFQKHSLLLFTSEKCVCGWVKENLHEQYRSAILQEKRTTVRYESLHFFSSRIRPLSNRVECSLLSIVKIALSYILALTTLCLPWVREFFFCLVTHKMSLEVLLISATVVCDLFSPCYRLVLWINITTLYFSCSARRRGGVTCIHPFVVCHGQLDLPVCLFRQDITTAEHGYNEDTHSL